MTKIKLLLTMLLLSLSGYAQVPDKAKLDRFFDRLAEKNKAMGSIMLAKNGKLLYARAIGHGAEKKPLTVDTKYRIGSVTKMFTAAMIFQLVEEGKVKLDQTIDLFFPQVPNAGKISIAHLLSHRSGINEASADPAFRALRLKGISREERLAFIAGSRPRFEPGGQYAYSNEGYFLLACIIEKLGGQSYEEALEKRITLRIGLRDTYNGTGDIDTGRNESFSYKYGRDWERQPDTHASIAFGSGSLISSAPDMARFIQALFEGKLVSAGSLDRMIKARAGIDTFHHSGKMFYGFTGGIDGFGAWLVYLPEEKLALSYATNGKVYPVGKLIDDVFDIYYHKPFPIPTFETMKISPAILDKYAGVYSPPGADVKFTVSREGERLFLQLTGQPAALLEPVDENTFKIEPAGIIIKFDVQQQQMTIIRNGGERVLKKENPAPPACRTSTAGSTRCSTGQRPLRRVAPARYHKRENDREPGLWLRRSGAGCSDHSFQTLGRICDLPSRFPVLQLTEVMPFPTFLYFYTPETLLDYFKVNQNRSCRKTCHITKKCCCSWCPPVMKKPSAVFLTLTATKYSFTFSG